MQYGYTAQAASPKSDVSFFCDLIERDHNGRHMLRQTNRLLLAIAERLNVQQQMPVTEQQIVRAARDWVAKTCSASCTDETRKTATKRFIFVAKEWLQFLGKWREPDRNPQFKPELDSYLEDSGSARIYGRNHFHSQVGAEPFLRVA